MIRSQAFIHFNEQPFEQKWIDMVYDLAPKVDKAKSSEKDPSGDGKYTKKDFLINIGVLDKDGNKINKK